MSSEQVRMVKLTVKSRQWQSVSCEVSRFCGDMPSDPNQNCDCDGLGEYQTTDALSRINEVGFQTRLTSPVAVPIGVYEGHQHCASPADYCQYD
jgi:hypothetical protein